jgi:hypothetical protein
MSDAEEVDARLPTHVLVSAHMRQAAAQGIPIVLLKRGDPQSGTLVLKINRLDGTAHVLLQTRRAGVLGWSPATQQDPLPEAEADAVLAQQSRYDPDVWLLEIEDRSGKHWFPGARWP